MSRVHDALRRAEQLGDQIASEEPEVAEREVSDHIISAPQPLPLSIEPVLDGVRAVPERLFNGGASVPELKVDWSTLLQNARSIPFQPAPEGHLIDLEHPNEVPGEEFRSLRTRLNHLQTQQPLHSVVVTSASPAEGKTFTAVNLALAQAQLAENPVLLADLDLRRPVIHHLFQTERSPGFSDFLLDGIPLESVIRRIGNTNLYFLPAGTPVKNPLELLNLKQVRTSIESLSKVFNWVIVDTPPLLFSADANLLATLTDGVVMVVRIGATTYDNVIRAMQSLCENTVLGIVANGARASELYSKYTYYYSKHD